MGTQIAPIDHAERDLAGVQLDDIVLANGGMADWKDAVLTWHLQAVAKARAEAWVPGQAPSQDPVVEEALTRFYRYHVGATIRRLRAENLDLRRSLMAARAAMRFYESGATDAGERAHSILERLQSSAVLAE